MRDRCCVALPQEDAGRRQIRARKVSGLRFPLPCRRTRWVAFADAMALRMRCAKEASCDGERGVFRQAR